MIPEGGSVLWKVTYLSTLKTMCPVIHKASQVRRLGHCHSWMLKGENAGMVQSTEYKVPPYPSTTPPETSPAVWTSYFPPFERRILVSEELLLTESISAAPFHLPSPGFLVLLLELLFFKNGRCRTADAERPSCPLSSAGKAKRDRPTFIHFFARSRSGLPAYQ